MSSGAQTDCAIPKKGQRGKDLFLRVLFQLISFQFFSDEVPACETLCIRCASADTPRCQPPKTRVTATYNSRSNARHARYLGSLPANQTPARGQPHHAQVPMFACMGCREDDAFLTCFGGAPLAEDESEAEPEKAPRRKVKRRESKRRAARRPADPPPKPESRWGLVRRSVVKEPKLVEVVAEATAYYDVSEARDRLRERLGKGVSTAQTRRMMLDVGADQHGRVSPRDFEVMVARFEEDRLVKKSRRKFWRRRAKKPPKAPKELYAPSAIHADAKALAKPLPKASACVEIKILRRARAESSRRSPRYRPDACSMAW